MRRVWFAIVVLSLFASVLLPLPANATPPWTPGPPQYGISLQQAIPVAMSDGTILRVDVQSPTAPGKFPVLLAQTPYGRAASDTDTQYFVQRGYVVVTADVRGTGASEGSWAPFAPIEATDGTTLVNWAASLPNSNGKVGLQGGSYLGINQLTTAAALGPNSPVKAIFPMVAGNDLSRDLISMGGMPDAEFMPLWEVLEGVTSVTAPLTGDPQQLMDKLKVELQHLGGLGENMIPLLTGTLGGGEQAYDGPYWQSRNPANTIHQVVQNGIPAYLVGGWNDLFQRGALMNYAALQNTWAGRPASVPMTTTQPVTSRYQLLMTPSYHDPNSFVDLPALQLSWYDHWLKGIDTGVTDTTNPLHLNVFGTSQYVDTTSYPFNHTTASTLYFGAGRTGTAQHSANDGALTATPPAGGATDWITWTLTNSTCTRSTAQWIGGFLPNPSCDTNNLDRESGINSLSYTSMPVSTPTLLAGPINVTVYAQANTTDTVFVATVTDVGPDGSSKPLTEGALIGSQRQVDPAKSWYASNGQPLMAYHPYTVDSEQPVVPNQVTRYDLEVFPTFAQIPAGHRIRVVLTTADTPHLVPTLTQLPHLLLGIYQVKSGQATPSSVTIPIASPADFPSYTCTFCK